MPSHTPGGMTEMETPKLFGPVTTRTFIFASADWMEIVSILSPNATATPPLQCH
jgi:hypothetical protein